MTNIEQKFKKIQKESIEIRREAKEKMISYVGAGFGVIVSLAWNEAIKALIEYIFPLKQDTILAKFIYAGAMTLILILVSLYLVKILKTDLEDKKSK